MSYRFDSRDKATFMKDILLAHKAELDIVLRISQLRRMEKGVYPNVIPAGTDFRGSFIHNDEDVSYTADFYLEPNFVEITRSKKHCKKYFHQKVGKVKKCVKEGFSIVFVNGHETPEPEYIFLSCEELKRFTKKSKDTYGTKYQVGKDGPIWNKRAYRYNVNWFNFQPLPILDNQTKNNYKNLIEDFNET